MESLNRTLGLSAYRVFPTDFVGGVPAKAARRSLFVARRPARSPPRPSGEAQGSRALHLKPPAPDRPRTPVRLLLPLRLLDLRRQRIHDAQRAGLQNHIRDEWHVAEARADALLDAWAITANERGLMPGQATYWQEGEEWIREHAKKR